MGMRSAWLIDTDRKGTMLFTPLLPIIPEENLPSLKDLPLSADMSHMLVVNPKKMDFTSPANVLVQTVRLKPKAELPDSPAVVLKSGTRLYHFKAADSARVDLIVSANGVSRFSVPSKGIHSGDIPSVELALNELRRYL
jgi:hypothetical protein